MNKIILLIFTFSYFVIFSQTKQITGTVKDYKTNKALQYVNIYIKGKSIGVSTCQKIRYIYSICKKCDIGKKKSKKILLL